MGIVVVTQAISTVAHTGVLRSCGEAYINHPAVRRPPGSVRLGAEAVVAGWMHDTIDEGTWVAVGFLRAARFPGSIIPAVVIGVPRGELYFGLVAPRRRRSDPPGTWDSPTATRTAPMSRVRPLNTVAG